jgi:hypothetical protein
MGLRLVAEDCGRTAARARSAPPLYYANTFCETAKQTGKNIAPETSDSTQAVALTDDRKRDRLPLFLAFFAASDRSGNRRRQSRKAEGSR